jgi:pimeloyl-ACP methyl ester carboxylesterase
MSSPASGGLDLAGELAGVTQPPIVVHGRDSRGRPPEQGRELASSLPNAEFRLVETGHSPVSEAPAAVAAAVGFRPCNTGLARCAGSGAIVIGNSWPGPAGGG